ncbi:MULTISPECIES: hypothetical protein [Lysinibacillus]|uniref:Uncharacterized protein n=1 Tax=Lysinibacillus sphaericus TaxID=1421 RepID=A0AAJ4ZW17_LYSSH|nr:MULTISPECIES: hypothetical protein [Lysinibacillus]MED4543079.1 hypothetical protein [Lysinibacillus sphaericus]GEC84305.1 hypothetical protein LSP03_40480 [Lysinibacillus sphaericus]SUV17458.1 Uncharacterised protein [Lysinibacillus sphaericus]
MFVKNLNTGITWAVTEEHGARLLRTEEFEEVQLEKPKRTISKKPEAETEK